MFRANENFCRISGYTLQELVGQDHRIVNSGFHPKEFWVYMWRTVSAGEAWLGYRKGIQELEQQFSSIGQHVAPSGELSLWSFDEAQLNSQLRSMAHLMSVRAVQLRREAGPDLHFGEAGIADAFERSFRVEHTESGRTHVLGTLTLVGDLAGFRAASLRQLATNFIGNTIVLLIVIGIVLSVHQALVRRRLMDVVNELTGTAPDDLRREASSRRARTPPVDEGSSWRWSSRACSRSA